MFIREPLNKPRMAATEAFRDEMREATRSPWQAPMGERRDKGDRPESPGPFGFQRNGPICVVARLANRMNYSLRPQLANAALHLRPLRQKRGSCGTCSEVPRAPPRERADSRYRPRS